MDAGNAGVIVHGNAYHSPTFTALSGSVTETITGLKTFSGATIAFGSGTAAAPGISFSAESALGLYRVSVGELGVAAVAGVTVANGSSGAYARLLLTALGGALGLGLNGTLDAYLYREAAAYLLQRDGTTSQRFGVARTYTDATNYEVGEIGWSGVSFRVGTSHAGTGSARSFALMAGGSERWTVDGTDGHLTAAAVTEQIRWGTTAAEPMLKRSGAGLHVRLADDSDYGALTADTLTTLDTLLVSAGSLKVESAGPHWISPDDSATGSYLKIDSFNPTSAITTGLYVRNGGMIPSAGVSAYGMRVGAAITIASSGIHDEFVGLRVTTLGITAGAGSVTSAASFTVDGAPTAATNNYAAWIKAGSVCIQGAGPHSIGTTPGANAMLTIGGTHTATGSGGVVVNLNATVNAAGVTVMGMTVTPTLVTILDTAHTIFASLRVIAPVITINGSATVATAASLYIQTAPTLGTANYALWIDSGRVRWDDSVALGGGAAPTLGTIGGSGPATAAQNQWLRVNIAGTEMFLAAWA